MTLVLLAVTKSDWEYTKKNIATFKMPEKATQDPKMLDDIATMVKELLTSQHSNIKQKLANSMKSKNHILLLARTLAPGNHFEIILNHWTWYAFMCSFMVMFNHLVHEGSNGMNESEIEEVAAAGGTAMADKVSIQTSTNGKEKILTSNKFWKFINTLLSQT
ncbi:hypothetical protein HD554DRAFT_2042019 [Boletus coccyginus]|nr:hypothetical protein HD554DRAFT_2042019 [Boletus coccyginus]